MLKITEEGSVRAGDVDDLPTDTESLFNLWSKFFKDGALRILRIAIDRYPESISRNELIQEAGIQAQSTFSTYLTQLRSNGLVEVNGHEVKASKELFENQ
jgi:hypothetical protein